MAVATRGRVRFTWVRSPSGMADDCYRRSDAMEPTLFSQLQALSQEIVSWMRQNRPWTDRTGNAKAGLSSNARITGKGTVTLSAFHTVPYGGFLETGTSKMSPYPVIRPGLQAHYGEARAIMNQIAGRG